MVLILVLTLLFFVLLFTFVASGGIAKERVQPANCLAVRLRENVPVDIGCRADLRVAERIPNNHQRHALSEQERCTAMAKIMEPDGGRQPGTYQHRLEVPMQVSWLHKCADT